MPTVSAVPVPNIPSLNIAPAITRIQGVAQYPQYNPGGYGSKREEISGPVPFHQTIATALAAVQAWANTLAGQVGRLATLAATITTTGTVTFKTINMVVSVDETNNKLTFMVRYSTGVTKTGSVNLT